MVIQNQNIVVVDDDASMNQAVKRLLEAVGFDTQSFRSAEALLQAGAAANADCLVLDICLPGSSGFELERQLSESGIRVPVIFITAHDKGGFHERAERAGAVALLLKPFGGEMLLEQIAKALTPSGPRRFINNEHESVERLQSLPAHREMACCRAQLRRSVTGSIRE